MAFVSFLERPLLVLFCVGIIVYYLAQRCQSSRRGKPLPMPRGLPIIGNVLQVGRMPWYKMTEWSKKLGPIYGLNLGGQSVIVLNSYQVATDILDKRSATSSGRPRMIMASEVLCGDHFFPFLNYGDQWRRFRKLAYEAFNPRAAGAYDIFQEREARILVDALMKDDDHWLDHLQRAVLSSTLALSYAVPPIKDCNDAIVTRINDFMGRLERAARLGEYMVDIFPWLDRLPNALASWRRYGAKVHGEDTNLFKELLWTAVKRNGTCVATFLASKIESGEATEKEAAWLSGTLFGAGSSTTSGAHRVFILAMILNPRVMHKAQAEIDAVVGRHRLPNAGDRDKLTYCRAVMREAFRWRNVGPLGVPHYLDRDEEYDGYHLPKNSIIFFNEWAMNHDVNVYGDPENFRPERFLDETETVENIPINTHGEGHTAFGYGRRKCIGFAVATNTLLLNIATLLWAFDIVKVRDQRGKEISPDPFAIHDEGLVAVPQPFPCRFVPRDPKNLPDILAQAHDTEQHY